MGDIWQADKLTLFLAFFVPGFIMTEVYGLFVAVGERDFAKQLPAVVAYSAIHYALTGWIILVAPEGSSRLAAAYIVVLVLPVLWTPIVLLLRDWGTWRKRILSKRIISFMLQSDATPWDRVFADTRDYWIRVRLKSGFYVGGLLGVGSSTSTYPCPEQIYITQEWKIDEAGLFVKPMKGAALLLNATEIEFIELIDPTTTGDSDV